MTKEEWLAELERVRKVENKADGFTVLDVAKQKGCTIEHARVVIRNLLIQEKVREVGVIQHGKGIANVYQVVK